MSPQIRNSAFGLYESFKVSYRRFTNWLKSPVVALYKQNIIDLVALYIAPTGDFNQHD